MNILYLAHRIPYPPDRGDKMRAFHQVARLSQRHRVWCACFLRDSTDQHHVEPLARYCQGVFGIPLGRCCAVIRGMRSLARGHTFTEGYFYHSAMTKAVERWAASISFDVAVAFSSSMAPYALTAPVKRRILDMCDLDSAKWMEYAAMSPPSARWLYQCEAARLAERERHWSSSVDATLLVTSAEATEFDDSHSGHQVYVVGNGVELQRQREAPTAGAPPTIGFVGVMDYPPNVDGVVWFARHCWPRIRATHPDARFRIIGRHPTRKVHALRRIPSIQVVGEVRNVADELAKVDVSVAPLRVARGLQNKVLEAMAAAKPVVLSPGAANGIEAQDGRDFLIADGADATVAAVTGLLADATARMKLGRAARRFVATHHRWDDHLAHFERIVTGKACAPCAARTEALGAEGRHSGSRDHCVAAAPD